MADDRADPGRAWGSLARRARGFDPARYRGHRRVAQPAPRGRLAVVAAAAAAGLAVVLALAGVVPGAGRTAARWVDGAIIATTATPDAVAPQPGPQPSPSGSGTPSARPSRRSTPPTGVQSPPPPPAPVLLAPVTYQA